MAPNKFLAKIASDLEKPDGLVVVDPSRVQEFLDPLPVKRLWGVGKVTGKTFEKLGIQTIGQLRQLSVEKLQHHFGNSGMHFWELAHGIDERPVTPEQEAKSISHEKTFSSDIGDPSRLRAWLLELTEQVSCRLRRQRTGIALAALADKVTLHFLPPYCPDYNKIERLWKDLHANVTRNHRCSSMDELMEAVHEYIKKRGRQLQHEYATRNLQTAA